MQTQKLQVVCDYREEEVAGMLSRLGAAVSLTSLEVGDFVISERVVVERKTYSDFVNSIIDGRIFQQAKQLQRFEKPILLIEGFAERKINENALKAALATLLLNFGVSVLQTRSKIDTARTIFWLAQKEGEANVELCIPKPKRKPKELRKIQEQVVASLPGISTVLSRRLLRHFKQVEKIFSAKTYELEKVKGISGKLAKRLRKIFEATYEEKEA